MVGTRQEDTSEAKDYLIKEANKVDVRTDATAFVFTAPLLEREPEVQHLISHTTVQLVQPLILYLHTNVIFTLVPWFETSQWTVKGTCMSYISSTHLLLKWQNPPNNTHIASHDVQHALCLVSASCISWFTWFINHMQMSHNQGQSSLKNLLHNCGKCNKTHSMTTRWEGQVALYDDAEDTSTPMRLLPCPPHHPLTV